MNRIGIFILFGYFALKHQGASSIEKSNPLITIEPVTSRVYGLYIVKRELDPLNLTCSVYDNSTDVQPRYTVTWSPPSSSNSKDHIVTSSSGNSVTLMIANLELKDEGTYACEARPLENASLATLNAEVVVNIKNRRDCGETMFTCSLSKYSNCIHRRFTCDGYEDCEMGEDEHHDICGLAPCNNKLLCQDHTTVVRCIPKTWCCNIRLDINCTIKEPLSCCPIDFQTFMDDRGYYETLKPHYSDMAFAIYTVIGCAVVFMVGVTVLIIAICRVYTRTQWHNTLPPRSTHHSESAAAMYDVDMYCGGPPSLLMTYNMGQGAQAVGRPLHPPPYSEVVSIPPKEGPPPPYTPMDVPEAESLLSQTLDQRADCDQQTSTDYRSD